MARAHRLVGRNAMARACVRVCVCVCLRARVRVRVLDGYPGRGNEHPPVVEKLRGY